MAGSRVAPGRLLSIDILKGLAALWVLLIHADALAGTVAMVYVFNRAAQIFVVLMGVNGELWWTGKDWSALARWFGGRLRRLYVPMWCAVAAWWLIAPFGEPRDHPALTAKLLVKHLSGYLIGIGTGWFVTVAIIFAFGFPVMHFVARRVGVWTIVACGIVSTCLSFAYRYEILNALGTYGWFVFPPRLLAELAFGLALAPFVARLGWRAGLASALMCAVYVALPLLFGPRSPWGLAPVSLFGASSATVCAHRLLDLPVTVLLLIGCAALAPLGWLSRPLVWLGRESYGIYLGQMVTHNALTMLVGFDAVRAAIWPLGYAGLLLVGALAWVFAGRGLALALRGWSGRGLERATADGARAGGS